MGIILKFWFLMSEVPLHMYLNFELESGLFPLYRGTSLIRKRPPVGPYSRAMPRALWWSWGGCVFL